MSQHRTPPWLHYHTRHVPPGEYGVSTEPDVVLSTLLGSCVAACLYDPEARVGGLNHFLLPEGKENLLYGNHAMEVLLNAILTHGGRRRSIVAKIFGGARMVAHAVSPIVNVGQRNVEFVRLYLAKEEFPLLSEDVGGTEARRIWMHPATGRVWVERLGTKDTQPLALSESRYRDSISRQPPAGDIDIFG
ncbi:chemotaxis protein CheD [Benzoatithermus flavus]|uniref:Probable chemoreceptor glutamine deamidase CheD n=1 Tax=Benzoatithermus flavus TaxID=3108223 RepID=A0ABU8XX59_9PROT